MPFDGKDFALPRVETDGVLCCLIDGRNGILRCWAKASDPNKQSGLCMWLALSGPAAGGATFLLARALPVPGRISTDLFKFNDDPATTLDDALAVYDRAIAARRGELP